MLVLGLSTTTPQIAVAVGDERGLRASWTSVQARRHAEVVTPAIGEVCAAAGVELTDVGAIAVDTGPGLFTGLRVGVATAKAMAFALDVPVVCLSSLDVLAFAYRYVSRRVTVTIDARRGEVFAATYVAVPGGMQRVTEPHTASPDEVAAEVLADPEPHLLVGNGGHAYPGAFAGNDRLEIADVAYPSAAALIGLARAKAERGACVRAEAVACTYLREPDAEINWQTRDGVHDERAVAHGRPGPGSGGPA